jgi:hypothetical protein
METGKNAACPNFLPPRETSSTRRRRTRSQRATLRHGLLSPSAHPFGRRCQAPVRVTRQPSAVRSPTKSFGRAPRRPDDAALGAIAPEARCKKVEAGRTLRRLQYSKADVPSRGSRNPNLNGTMP